MRRIFLIMAVLLLPLPVWAEEQPAAKQVTDKPTAKATKNTYDLPRDQVQEYRALEAERRAAKAEVTLALKEIEDRQKAIIEGWRLLTKEDDLSAWEIDIAAGKLKKKDVSK